MAVGLPLAPLLPFGGHFSALGLSAFQSLVARFGTTAVAGRLAMVLLRTLGRVMNVSGFLPGLPIRATPVTRALTGPFTIFPATLFFPGLNSFLAGFAYRDNEELTSGWLSFFGELLLKDVPLVEGNLEKAMKSLGKGDWVGFGLAAADALAEDVGLEGLAAFFRGVQQADVEFRQVAPFGLPAGYFFGTLIGVVGYFDVLLRTVGRVLGGTLEELFDPKVKARPPTPGEKAAGEEEIARMLRRLEEVKKDLPTTEKDTGRFLARFKRVFRGFLGFRGVLDLIKKSSDPGKTAIQGFIRAAQRLLG